MVKADGQAKGATVELTRNMARFLDTNVWQFGEYWQFIYLGSSVEKSLTNSELLEKARFLATGLRIHGIRKGEVVATLLNNIPRYPRLLTA